MSICQIICLGFLCLTAVGAKSQCSKYDFEEKVLEKMVRIEFETERMKASIADSLNTMQNIKNSVESSLKTLDEQRSATETKLENKLAELEKRNMDKISELEKFAELVSIQTVAFKASMTSSTSVSVGQTIIFTTVIFNEGQGYNQDTGIFTVPYNGTYIFTTLICPYVKKFFNYGFMVDGELYTVVTLYTSEDSTCQSADSIAILRVGQQVWIKTLPNLSSGAGISQDAHRWSTFSGVLIHK